MVDPVLCRYRRGLGLDLVVWRIPDKNGKLLHWGRNPGLDPVLRKADVFYSRRHDQDDDGAFGGGAFGPELPRAASLDIDAMRAKAIELVGPDVVALADKLQRLGFAQRFRADHRSVMEEGSKPFTLRSSN